MSGIDKHVDEAVAGQCATVAALVIAFDECGVLPKSRYRDVLHRLWLEMPEQQAVGEAGAVLERVLDLVGTGAETGRPSDDTEQKRETRTSVSGPTRDDGAAEPSQVSPRALLRALFRAWSDAFPILNRQS